MVWHVGEPARRQGAKPRSPAGSAAEGPGGQGVSPAVFNYFSHSVLVVVKIETS